MSSDFVGRSQISIRNGKRSSSKKDPSAVLRSVLFLFVAMKVVETVNRGMNVDEESDWQKRREL